MPLRGDAEGEAGVLDGLHDAVRAARCHGQPLAQGVDRLVVVDGSQHAIVLEGREQRSLSDRDAHLREDAVRTLVVRVSHHLGKVLVEGSAPRHVENLRSSTNAEDGKVDAPSKSAPEASSCSGCHCVATQKVRLESSTACTMPSAQRAVTVSPRPGRRSPGGGRRVATRHRLGGTRAAIPQRS